MALHHISQGPGLIKITRSLANSGFLGHGDLHVIDVVPIPQRLYDRVRESKYQQVLNGLFPQIMIDSKNLLLFIMAMQFSIEIAGAG